MKDTRTDAEWQKRFDDAVAADNARTPEEVAAWEKELDEMFPPDEQRPNMFDSISSGKEIAIMVSVPKE